MGRKKKYAKENLEERKGAAARGRKKPGSTCIGFFLGSTCIGGDFEGSTCTEEEKGQQLRGGKNRGSTCIRFFWAAHAMEEILGAAHALKRKRGSS